MVFIGDEENPAFFSYAPRPRRHGTLVRANASDKSFVPIELAMDPDEYKRRLGNPFEDRDPDRTG
jgi:hypothetical protein